MQGLGTSVARGSGPTPTASAEAGMQAVLDSGLPGIDELVVRGVPSDRAPGADERRAFIGAVVRGLLDEYLPTTRFGTLHQDLLAYAAATSDMLQHPPMRAFLAAALSGAGETAKEAAAALAAHLEAHGRAIVGSAEGRGEIAGGASAIAIVDLVIGPVWLDGLLAGAHRTDAQLAELAELAVRRAQLDRAGRYA